MLSNSVMSKLLANPSNSQCFDCQTPKVNWASISFGIFLCNTCAGMHRGLRLSTSHTKHLTEDEWLLPDLVYLISGGNPAFRSFLKPFPFPYTSISYIYKTKAAAYYKVRLKSIALGELFDIKPPTPQEGIETVDFLQNKMLKSIIDQIGANISSKMARNRRRGSSVKPLKFVSPNKSQAKISCNVTNKFH